MVSLNDAFRGIRKPGASETGLPENMGGKRIVRKSDLIR